MLDNEASKSPSGLDASIRYCAYTNATPRLRPSTRSFKGMGHGTMSSLGTATIRMPIDDHYFISFDVDVVDHDIPLFFGLEHHKNLRSSSNEVENTFTHYSSNTTIPVVFVKDPRSDGGRLYVQ